MPSKALRTARLLIALGLTVGILVFAVFTIEELKAGVTTYANPTGFGAADTTTTEPPPAPKSPNPMAGLTTTDPTKYIPILRDNPHPGEIVPFMKADPLGQPPYRQPSTGNEVWEFCVYEVRDANMIELLAYYDRQAKDRGMGLVKQKPTSDKFPGGIVASWSDGQITLEVTVRPLPPPQPPLAPASPHRWVVKYSYPEPTPAR